MIRRAAQLDVHLGAVVGIGVPGEECTRELDLGRVGEREVAESSPSGLATGTPGAGFVLFVAFAVRRPSNPIP